MAAQHLVVVGKSGVGKSTTAANLAAALADAGKRVVLIGYDTRWNTTATLRGDNLLAPIPHWNGEGAVPFYARGFRSSLCIEAGDLTIEGEAVGATELLRNPLVREYDPDYVIHDVSWEPAASFVLPAAAEGVIRVLAVTSADMGAIHAVNELFAWLNTVSATDCRFGGVVVNNLSGPLYESIVSDFANLTGATVAASVTHSLMVSVSDFYNQTLIEAAPSSHVTYAYRKVARTVLDDLELRRPAFLDTVALKEWAVKWGEIITELETGLVRDGSNI
ncbi:nucleotide-binding protein [Geomesophilobacter sediminis]|uniref:AAA family ATPase n=1 Tax=Geomesophilobacter sediminis TaxID=2798584 RepID=A0A8J7J098_9BACT|nr:AAA family ATPase [Geomesophilobacter sediminis]MBJ6723748.1 AAA family ATPase [Geomesophilobacter sediminis]